MKITLIKNFSFIAVICLILSGCEKRFGEGVSLKDIETGKASYRISLGSYAKAEAYPVPWDCTNYEFTWSSANPSIATVDNYGKITAEDIGTTTITVSSGSISKTFTVESYEVQLEERLKELDVKGLWQFMDANNLYKATVGSDLVPAGGGFEQRAGFNPRTKSIYVPKGSRMFYDHGFAANGGGSRVNNFTILVDMKFSERVHGDGLSGPYLYPDGTWKDGWYYSLYSAAFGRESLEAEDDGSFFWRPSGNWGILSLYTQESRLFQKDTWYRFVICAEFGSSIRYWQNGVRRTPSSNGDRDQGNRTLPLYGILFFADDDGEDNAIEVASLAIWDKALSDDEVRSIGNLRLR